jgi:hypothetical protein
MSRTSIITNMFTTTMSISMMTMMRDQVFTQIRGTI